MPFSKSSTGSISCGFKGWSKAGIATDWRDVTMGYLRDWFYAQFFTIYINNLEKETRRKHF